MNKSFVDFRLYNLKLKTTMIREENLSEGELKFDEYQLALMLESIFENNKGDIEN